ncbi:hypothetical protein F5B18DRAFT_594885 [Nemania serpens]|nr:hypothetical protein F5B18DRAFT_594885 [Nemania serpens]
MAESSASAWLEPPCLIPTSKCGSGPTTKEPAVLSPWQRRWNMEWLNEAYIPYMRHNDLLMERSSKRDKNYRRCQKTRPGTEKFMSNAIEAGIASPKSTLTRTPWPCGTRHVTWPVRMLASHTRRLWGRWRKHREEAKKCRMVIVMEEHGETPRWKGELKLTFQDGFFFPGRMRPSNWIDIPSAQDVKWYLIRSRNGLEWLQGGQSSGSWAPNRAEESCIPFVMVNGSVARNCRPHEAHERADGNVFDNFELPCPHCGRR